MLDIERIQNLKTRVRNLNEHSPLSSWLDVMDEFINVMRLEYLETVHPLSAQIALKIEINERKKALLKAFGIGDEWS